MKASISRIELLSIILAGITLAQAANENFPAPGRTYNVAWAKDAQVGRGQIKVLRKGEGSWIFVEYSHPYLPQPGPSSSDKPPRPPESVKSDVKTRKMWINMQWLVDTSEITNGI